VNDSDTYSLALTLGFFSQSLAFDEGLGLLPLLFLYLLLLLVRLHPIWIHRDGIRNARVLYMLSTAGRRKRRACTPFPFNALVFNLFPLLDIRLHPLFLESLCLLHGVPRWDARTVCISPEPWHRTHDV
jgi:hypothetical protein